MADPVPVPNPPTRREFLASSGRALGGGWLALQLPALGSLAACSREAAERGETLTTLTPREGNTVAALADMILPADDELPGAREVGVVHFVDGALERHFPVWLDLIRPGLEDLEERAAAAHSGGLGGSGADQSAFAALSEDQRADLIREIEDTPFFFVARMLVVMGMFSDPVHGGNRAHAGWEFLGMDHAPAYDPPFGHYDEVYAREQEQASRGDPPAGPDTRGAS